MRNKYFTFYVYTFDSRKASKVVLQNIYLMLELLNHNCNSLITSVVDGSILYDSILKKMLEDIISAWVFD